MEAPVNLLVAGLNHRVTPVALREKLAFSGEAIPGALERLRADVGVAESVILSTCNRVEIYAASDRVGVSAERVTQFLESFHGMPDGSMRSYFYAFQGIDAARHLFRVASALDSMVIGETQILGQVREAYRLAADRDATGRILDALFQRALQVGKEVQSTTAISTGRTSVSSVAVDFARRIFRNLAGRTVLVVGAGEMGEATLKHLQGEGIGRVIVANRNEAHAEEMARRFGGTAVGLDRLESALGGADIVLSCSGAPGFVVGANSVRHALAARRKQPIFIVDIAVPRNVDPAVNDLDNVYLYNIDDLQEVVAKSVEVRAQEVVRGEALVEHAVVRFGRDLRVFRMDPILSGMAREFERIREEELGRALEKLPALGEAERREIEALTHRLTKKLLHRPLQNVKGGALDDDGADLLRALQKLFQVGDGD